MRNAIRLLAAALALVALPGGSGCEEGNLGDVSSGPVSFRVSIDRRTVPSDGPSSQPAASADGRYVAFASRAGNLAFTADGFQEILVRDRLNDTTENVSKLTDLFNVADRADCLQPAISADGRWVLFRTTSGLNLFGGVMATTNVFRWDRQNQELTAVAMTWPDNDILNATISEDGMRVAFETAATTAPFPGAGSHVFVADFTGVTLGDQAPITLISHANGAPATPANGQCVIPQISADGNWVVYQSRATNLTADVVDNDRKIWLSAADGASTELVSRDDGALGAPLDNHCSQASVSRDGRYVSFLYQGGSFAPGPSVGGDLRFPVVRRDRVALETDLVATDCFGFAIFTALVGGPPTVISDDGRFIAYIAVDGPVATDLFTRVRDMQGGTFNPSISMIPSTGAGLIDFPTCTLSGDGRWVFWASEFDGQVLNDTNGTADVFGFGSMR